MKSRNIVIVRRMYDPEKKVAWFQSFRIRANSREELKEELAKLNLVHPLWTGETPHG